MYWLKQNYSKYQVNGNNEEPFRLRLDRVHGVMTALIGISGIMVTEDVIKTQHITDIQQYSTVGTQQGPDAGNVQAQIVISPGFIPW